MLNFRCQTSRSHWTLGQFRPILISSSMPISFRIIVINILRFHQLFHQSPLHPGGTYIFATALLSSNLRFSLSIASEIHLSRCRPVVLYTSSSPWYFFLRPSSLAIRALRLGKSRSLAPAPSPPPTRSWRNSPNANPEHITPLAAIGSTKSLIAHFQPLRRRTNCISGHPGLR